MKDQEFYRRLSSSTDEPTHRSVHIDSNRITHIRYNGPIRFQQDQQEYLLKGLPFIIVSTSSLVQISHTCKNITCLNLSYTSLLYDSLVAETGEYLSTLQRYAVQPGLTHIQIPIEQAIRSIGKECTQLQQVKIQRCEWVTAHVIWMFVYYCTNLKKLDARRSTKCTVKRLIAGVLEDTCSQQSQQQQQHQQQQQQQQQQNDDPSVTTLPSSSASSPNNDYATFFNEQSNTEEEEEEENNVTVHFRFNGELLVS